MAIQIENANQLENESKQHKKQIDEQAQLVKESFEELEQKLNEMNDKEQSLKEFEEQLLLKDQQYQVDYEAFLNEKEQNNQQKKEIESYQITSNELNELKSLNEQLQSDLSTLQKAYDKDEQFIQFLNGFIHQLKDHIEYESLSKKLGKNSMKKEDEEKCMDCIE